MVAKLVYKGTTSIDTTTVDPVIQYNISSVRQHFLVQSQHTTKFYKISSHVKNHKFQKLKSTMAKAAASKKKKQTNNNKQQHATVDNSSEPNKDNSNKRGKEDKTEGKIVGEVTTKIITTLPTTPKKVTVSVGKYTKAPNCPPIVTNNTENETCLGLEHPKGKDNVTDKRISSAESFTFPEELDNDDDDFTNTNNNNNGTTNSLQMIASWKIMVWCIVKFGNSIQRLTLFPFACYKGDKCIAKIVCGGVHINIGRWNDEFKNVVREEIRIRRNSCTTAIKKQYMSKQTAYCY